MHAKLRGEWLPESPDQRATVGHSHVLPPVLRHDRAAARVRNRLRRKAASRLCASGYRVGGLSVSVR